MNIVVCCKQINEVQRRAGDHLFRVNPQDEAALHLALDLKAAGAPCRVIILTLGSLRAEQDLRRCLALGADRLCRVAAPDSLDPWQKAILLGRAVRQLEGSLIFCGMASRDRGNGLVGGYLAQEIGMPLVSAVTEVRVDWAVRSVRLFRKGGPGLLEKCRSSLPLLCTVGTEPGHGRPALRARRQAGDATIEELSIDLELPLPKLRRLRVFPARPRCKAISTPDCGLPAHKRIEALLTLRAGGRKNHRLTGSPEEQVEAVVAFLAKLGLTSGEERSE